MIFQLLGSLVLGICGAVALHFAYRLSGRRAPRWVLPVSAGAAMFGYHIWSDYTWFQRTAAALPAPLIVAAAPTSASVMQPWTYLVPRAERFAALDPRAIRWNARAPGLRLAEVFLLARYMPTLTAVQVFDCTVPRRADAPQGLALDEEGRPVGVNWVPLDADDPLRRTVCGVALPDQPAMAVPDSAAPPAGS